MRRLGAALTIVVRGAGRRVPRAGVLGFVLLLVVGSARVAGLTEPVARAAASTAPCGLVAPSTRPYTSVFVLMDENLTYPAWQATPDSPYTHLLAKNCRLETNAAGETHPSFPNYLAVASGGFVTCLACADTGDNVFHQLDVAHLQWRSYEQSMPRNCAPNTSTVPYYRNGHNPAYWFTDLGKTTKGGDGSCLTNDVPLDPNLWNDLKAGRLPSFGWVTPDDCRDMHWMSATPAYKAGNVLIVITWDESNEGSVLNKGNWGMNCASAAVYKANVATCQVTTILVSSRIKPGPATAFYSHYSLTRAIEQNFHLPLLGGAKTSAAAPIY